MRIFAAVYSGRQQETAKMVVVAQLVRALDCGSRGRRFEPDLPPSKRS